MTGALPPAGRHSVRQARSETMKSDTPLVSVVICTHNRARLLASALRSVCAQTASPDLYEVLVVDNDSTDNTRMVVEDYARPLSNVRYALERRLGLSHARNRGWREARGAYVAYMDDDATAAPAWLGELLKVIGRPEPPDILGGPYAPFYLTDKPTWYRDAYGAFDLGEREMPVLRAPFLCGSNIAVRRAVLRALGGFRPELGMRGADVAYGEETELQMRALKAGFRIMHVPTMRVLHLVPPGKMTLRWLVRSSWNKGVARARMASMHPGMTDGGPALLGLGALVRHAAANAGLLVLELGRGPLRDVRSYPLYEDYFVEKALPAVGGLGTALETIRLRLAARAPSAEPSGCTKQPFLERNEEWTELGAEFQPGLVSVIVPTRNRAPLIGETLQSVRAQTYRPIELIVVDDGSTDHTAAVVERFAGQAGPGLDVRCLRQEHGGAPSARNRGLAESRGEFIQFLDSDDLLVPEKLSRQVDIMLREPQVAYVFSQWEHFSDSGARAPQRWRPGLRPDLENITDLMLGKDPRQNLPLWTANGLYRRQLCRRLGPWPAWQMRLQDRLYNLRMLLSGVTYRYIPRVHAKARVHPGARIADSFAYPEALANMRRTWREVRELLAGAGMLSRRRACLLGRIYYELARPAMVAGMPVLGMELLAEGLSLCPFSPPWLKLHAARTAYRLLGLRAANRLFALKGGLVALAKRCVSASARPADRTGE